MAAAGRPGSSSSSGEVKVGQEQRCPLAVDRCFPSDDRTEDDPGSEDGGDDDHRGRRDDASGSPAVEGQDRGGAGRGAFPQQHAGDDEAGDDEEDVDPDVPPADAGDRVVIEDHEHNGHRSESLYIGAEPPVAGRRPRLVLRCLEAVVSGDCHRFGHGRHAFPARAVPPLVVSLSRRSAPAGTALPKLTSSSWSRRQRPGANQASG